MRAPWHDVWGCADGPVTRLAPPVRLLAGAGVFSACMILPADGVTGPTALAGVVAAWLAACRPPGRVLRALLLLGLALFAPYFLLAPLLLPESAGGTEAWREALRAPWAVFLRGAGGMLVTAASVTTLRPGDLREALCRLPVPRLATAIVLQVVHQTPALASETRRIAAAMAVRGASGGGRASLRLVSAVPSVWLPRVLLRAERVAAAMELRGYVDGSRIVARPAPLRLADGTALAATLAVVGLALLLRLGGAP